MAKMKEPFAQRLISWFTGTDREDDTTVLMSPDMLSRSLVAPPTPTDKRYEIIKVLGKGAFGVVYLARDLRIGRLLAMKQLYGEYTKSAEIHQRFLQEARIAGQIENPNIVTIYDVDEENGTPCILMEYLAGGNLSTLLRLDAPLSETNALKLIRGIVYDLQAAHHKGVVHRDIKPQNILFDQSGTPKISDFGVAHLPREAGGIDEEGSQQVAGTPYYMAPEQMGVGGQPVDARADLYAVGLLFYEMLTGERYHEVHGTRDIRRLGQAVAQAGSPSIREFPEGVSTSTKRLIFRLLQNIPANRYTNATEVLNVIDELIEDAQVVADVKENADTFDESRLEMFADILRLFLVDGVISAPERRELTKRATRLGISQTDANKLEEDVRQEFALPLLKHLQEFEKMAVELLVDREYSGNDAVTLRELGESYGISLEEQRKIEDNVMIKLEMKEGDEEELIP